MTTIFDLYSDVVGNPFNSLLTLLIASVKCKQGFNRLLSGKVFFKVALYLFISLHLELVFVILEFSVYLCLIRLECVWCLNSSRW